MCFSAVYRLQKAQTENRLVPSHRSETTEHCFEQSPQSFAANPLPNLLLINNTCVQQVTYFEVMFTTQAEGINDWLTMPVEPRNGILLDEPLVLTGRSSENGTAQSLWESHMFGVRGN